jgi:hypothetical protein
MPGCLSRTRGRWTSGGTVRGSRRTREIGLRAALGANPRHVLIEILSRAVVLMGSGIAVGGAFLLLLIAVREEDVALFAGWLGITCAVMSPLA